MKRLFLSAFTAIASCCVDAYATQYRCMPFDINFDGVISCDYVEDGLNSMESPNGMYNIDWSQNCTYSGESAPYGYPYSLSLYVSGIAQCGTDGSTEQVLETLPEADEFGSVYCYCKMTYPFVSQWVSADVWEGNDGLECRRNCAAQCARAFGENPEVRTAMAQNLAPHYVFADIAWGLVEAEDVEFFELDDNEWRTNSSHPAADVIEPNRCPYGSSVFALRHLTVERMCEGKKIIGKTRSCLESADYSYSSGEVRVRDNYYPISDCSMYVPDVHSIYEMQSGLPGVEGNSISNPEETFYYQEICPLTEG